MKIALFIAIILQAIGIFVKALYTVMGMASKDKDSFSDQSYGIGIAGYSFLSLPFTIFFEVVLILSYFKI